MHRYVWFLGLAVSKTAGTIQVHGIGPFTITYVNPADDPSQQKK